MFRSRTEHEPVVLGQQLFHIDFMIPGELRKNMIVQILVEERIVLLVRFEIGAVHVGRHAPVEFVVRPWRVLRNAAGLQLVVVLHRIHPDPRDLSADFLRPFAYEINLEVQHILARTRPGAADGQHHLHIVGYFEIRNETARTIRHLSDIRIEAFSPYCIRDGDRIAPYEIGTEPGGQIETVCLVVARHAVCAPAGLHAVLRHQIHIFVVCAHTFDRLFAEDIPHRRRMAELPHEIARF